MERRGKPEYPEEIFSEQAREPTTNGNKIWNKKQVPSRLLLFKFHTLYEF